MKENNNALSRIVGDAKSIAFIGQKGIPAEFVGTSGIEFYVEYRAHMLVQLGKKVFCYVRDWATPKTLMAYKGICLIHIPTFNTKHFDAIVHSLLSSIHVSFMNVDTIWYQAMGPALFSFIPKLFGKKIIVTIHALDWKRDKWSPFAKGFLHFSERIAVMNAKILVVVSDELQRYYQTTYRKASIVDLPMVETLKKVKANIITEKYGLKGNDYILYMGRFVPEKRIEWLIEAYKNNKLRDVYLVLAGASSHEDAYEKSLRRLSVGFKKIIFTGYVFGEEKKELLSNCRIFILPSSLEGNPTVLYEVHRGADVLLPRSLMSGAPTYIKMTSFEDANKENFFEKTSLLLRRLYTNTRAD